MENTSEQPTAPQCQPSPKSEVTTALGKSEEAHSLDSVRESPNDLKLSDGGAWRGACPTVERTPDAPNVDVAPLAESTRRDTRSCSLERMVRRHGWTGENPTNTKEDILARCSDANLQKPSEQLLDYSGLVPSPQLVDRSGRVLRYNGWSAGAVEEMTPNIYSGQHTL